MYVFVCLFIWQDITAYPVSDDMMNWKAEIEGLRNSVCEGSCFKINLSYRENKREGGRKEDRGRGKREEGMEGGGGAGCLPAEIVPAGNRSHSKLDKRGEFIKGTIEEV